MRFAYFLSVCLLKLGKLLRKHGYIFNLMGKKIQDHLAADSIAVLLEEREKEESKFVTFMEDVEKKYSGDENKPPIRRAK